MFHKFKITTCAFILCLFGLTLITVSPVFAESFEESARVLQCEQSNSADEKANCYKEFARSYYDAQQSSADIKEHNRLNSGNYVKRKNGNVERKKAKDYAKDSAIKQAVNADPGGDWPRFIRYMVEHRDEAAMEGLQEYLQRARLSSFGRIALRKKG